MQSSNTSCFNNIATLGADVPPGLYNQNTNTHLTTSITQFNVPNSTVPVQLTTSQPTHFAQSLFNNPSVNNSSPVVGQFNLVSATPNEKTQCKTSQRMPKISCNVNTAEFNVHNVHLPPSPTTSVTSLPFPNAGSLARTPTAFPTGNNLLPPGQNMYPTLNFASVGSFPTFYPVAGTQNQFANQQQQSTNSVPVAVPQPVGYETGDSPQMQPVAVKTDSKVWNKADPAQTPTQQQVFFTPAPFTPAGNVYFQTADGTLIPQYLNFGSAMTTPNPSVPSEGSDKRISPSGSVESGTSMSTTSHVDPAILGVSNGLSIQNFGNACQMKFLNNSYIVTAPNSATTPPTPFFPQQNMSIPTPTTCPNPSPQMANNRIVMEQLITPTNQLAQSPEKDLQGHRGPSRQANSRTPPGFAEATPYAHRVNNIAKENRSSSENREYNSHRVQENRRSNYTGRNNEMSRKQNGNRRRPYNGNYKRDYKAVPMVDNSRKRNQKQRKNRNSYTDAPRQRTNRRYGYRTKQNKIEKVYAAVTEHFAELGVLIPEDVGIRGTNVARLHVKKWHSLCRIEEAIEKVESDARIVTQRVSCPVSMKNLYQKKGFLIYWETQDEEQTKLLMDVFRSYDSRDKEGKFVLDEFQKISVAVQTAEQKEKQAEAVGEQQIFSPFVETVQKAVVASLDKSAAEPTIYLPEEKDVPAFHSKDAELAFDDDLAFPLGEKEDDFTILPLRKLTSANSLCGA